MEIVSILRGLLGMVIILGIAYLLSNNKKKINWRLVGGGLALQLIFAIFILRGETLGSYFAPLGYPKAFFEWISGFFVLILDFTETGAEFVFGTLALSPENDGSLGMFFAFQVLPTIIFFASLMAILYHLGIMQWIVKGMAWVMAKIMGTSGAESLSCSANVFIGQTEAPLMIKPFIKNLTQSELLTVMTGGMATIAGGVMAAYIKILGSSFAASMQVTVEQAEHIFATQLLGASVMAAPAALLISKIIYPEAEEPETSGTVKVNIEKDASNVIEAAANGAGDGLKLALNVGAMLLAFIALIYMFNHILFNVGELFGLNSILMETYGKPLSFQFLIGWILQWIAYGIGVPWEDALDFGSLIGTKVVLNEFVAYVELGDMIKSDVIVNEKVIFMATYALCGFANLSSLAIQLGGLGPIAPSRKSDIAKLGMRAVIGGSLATLLTATLAGIFFSAL